MFLNIFIPTILSILIYTNSLHGDFVMDDSAAIVKNMDLRSNMTTLSDVFTNDFWGTPIHTEDSHKSYRPLTVLTYRFNFYLHGLDTFGYHVINVLAHGIATCLFTLCAIDLFASDSSSSSDLSKQKSLHLGTNAGLLFALHPIHTEAVSSIVGRAETLSAIFFCVIYLLYSKCITNSSNSLFLCCLLQLCVIFPLAITSMLCKEGGLTILGTCLVLDIASSRADPFKTSWIHTVVRAVLSIAFVVVTLILRSSVLTVTSFSPTFSDVDNYIHYSKDASTKFRSYAYLHYLYVKQLVVPFQLSCDWSYEAFPLLTSWSDPRLLLPFCVYSIALYLCYIAWQKKETALLVSTLGLGILPFVPSSNLLFPVATVLGERLLYLPSMGYVILVSIVIHKSTLQLNLNKIKFRTVNVSIVLLICTLYSTKTWNRNKEWKTALDLFTSAIRVVPKSCKAQVCVAAALNDIGTTDSRMKALPYIENAFRIKQDYAGAWFIKGTIMRELNRKDEAARSFQMTIKHSSEKEYKPDVLYLGLVNFGALMMHGELLNYSHFGKPHRQLQLAKKSFEEALFLEPNRYAPNANQGEVLSRLSEWDKALYHYEVASKHRDVQSDLFNNYAIAVYKHAVLKNPTNYGMEVIDQVIELYLRAIELNPNYINPRRNIGRIYYRQKKYQLAEMEFGHCVRIEKLDGKCWYDRGLCAMRMKEYKKASIYFDTLLNTNKMNIFEVNMGHARQNYETVKRQLLLR